MLEDLLQYVLCGQGYFNGGSSLSNLLPIFVRPSLIVSFSDTESSSPMANPMPFSLSPLAWITSSKTVYRMPRSKW